MIATLDDDCHPAADALFAGHTRNLDAMPQWTSSQQASEWYDPKKLGKWRMAIGTAVRALCRAPKSREGDHFQGAVGLKSQLCGHVPEVPDFAHDMHTLAGRRKGRGLAYFREESTRLVPAPNEPDQYEDECYAMWKLLHSADVKEKTSGGDDRRLFT